MYETIKNFLRDESGTETVEWAVLAALLVIIAATAFTGLGTAVVTNITALTAAI